jgi:hypothetical protein
LEAAQAAIETTLHQLVLDKVVDQVVAVAVRKVHMR